MGENVRERQMQDDGRGSERDGEGRRAEKQEVATVSARETTVRLRLSGGGDGALVGIGEERSSPPRRVQQLRSDDSDYDRLIPIARKQDRQVRSTRAAQYFFPYY